MILIFYSYLFLKNKHTVITLKLLAKIIGVYYLLINMFSGSV